MANEWSGNQSFTLVGSAVTVELEYSRADQKPPSCRNRGHKSCDQIRSQWLAPSLRILSCRPGLVQGAERKSLLLREGIISKRHRDRIRELRRHSANWESENRAIKWPSAPLYDASIDDTATASLKFEKNCYWRLIFSRINGSEIETVCPCGAFQDTDPNPRFSCAHVGGYVVRQTRQCNCARRDPKSWRGVLCQPWPIMPGLVGIHSNRTSLRAEKRHVDSTPSRALVRKKDEGPSRPKVVELWCIQCRENTPVQGPCANKEGNMSIDNDAEWTLGKTRPTYYTEILLPDMFWNNVCPSRLNHFVHQSWTTWAIFCWLR